MSAKSVRPLWLILGAATLIVFLGMGFRGVYGLFLEPISSHLDWGRGIFAMTFAIQNIFWGLTQPFAGGLADKYGSGRVMGIGGLVYVTGIALMSQVSSPILMHLTGGVMIGIGQGLASQSIAMATVARHAPEHRRTLAMAVVTMGGSAGMLIFSPLAAEWISGFGYVHALLIFAGITALVLPLSFLLSGKPPVSAAAVNWSFGDAIREASGHRGYWLLISGFCLRLPRVLHRAALPCIYRGLRAGRGRRRCGAGCRWPVQHRRDIGGGPAGRQVFQEIPA